MWGRNVWWRSGFAYLLVSVVLPAQSFAQMSANPPEVAARVAALGRTLSPEVIAATKAIYLPLQPRPPFANVRIHRDLAYGQSRRNRLDVFVPEPLPNDPLPVLIFMHGGSLNSDNKTGPASVFYDNIGVWAATHGLIGINIDYRLAPKHPWPAAIEDLGEAVQWAIQNVAPFGGEPDRIYVMGHSAGAMHLAGYISHPDLQPAPGVGIKGAILLSGDYDLTAGTVPDQEKTYFGSDTSLYAERSALNGIVQSKLPLLVAVGELDIPRAEQQGNLLNKTACAQKQCPQFLRLSGHNHMSEVYSINTPDVTLTNAILGFIKAH
jgi:acetyl esterase/lipase